MNSVINKNKFDIDSSFTNKEMKERFNFHKYKMTNKKSIILIPIIKSLYK
jgi:hypothetical protein